MAADEHELCRFIPISYFIQTKWLMFIENQANCAMAARRHTNVDRHLDFLYFLYSNHEIRWKFIDWVVANEKLQIFIF